MQADHIKKLFGSHMRRLRRDRDLTQAQVAELADLHQTYVAEIETGRRNPGLVNIVYLARALDVTPGELFESFTQAELRKLKLNNRNASRSRREK
jgi:transcriptional regulator with XRE-family HTH domain